MPTLDDVAAIALGLPEVEERPRHGVRTWFVRDKAFAWERPFSQADIKRFGDEKPPTGEIVAVRAENVAEKEAILASGQRGFFTIPHFNGYPGYLIQLKLVTKRALREAVVDAWLAQAPKKLAHEYVDSEGK